MTETDSTINDPLSSLPRELALAMPDEEEKSTNLTHVHLRKAKLMFLYQRYPSSALLKSYFPDVHFNKNNLAQLVKWFSNFREFLYVQSEIWAKQALAEGVQDANEIHLSEESEVFERLQHHYKGKGAFQSPESWPAAVEHTVRAFFVALQQGRDSEPSWKHQIYEAVRQLDEPVPEHMREPHFEGLLDQQTQEIL